MPYDKLPAQAVQGVFVGYSTTQKGFHCYDPTSKCTFITKDAFSDENTFFLTIPPSTVENYPSHPTQDESTTRRIEDSRPLQYPSLHLSEDPILDQRTPKHEGATSAPQPTSFTYFPKYYIDKKLWNRLNPLPPRVTWLNWSINIYLNTLVTKISHLPFANLVVLVSIPTHILFQVF